ncbi:GntR family transcriptional regulator [Demequina sp.]|uniref:GntR family transcriptional regulator n=1 Tax=Demequina sp. TaxID=2050685 RepID=UPI003D0B272D
MPIPTEPNVIRDAPARHEVRARLERLLVSGELVPGARLSDSDLLRLTDSSRGPLREALNELALVGLVEVTPRRSTRVAPVDAVADRNCLEIEGAVMRQVIVEVVGTLGDDDRAAIQAASRALFASAGAYRHGVRARDHRKLLEVFVARVGNREYQRLLTFVTPLVDRHAALHVDAVSRELRARFAAAIDATLGDDAEAAGHAWDEFSRGLLADIAYGGSPAAAPARHPVTLRDKAAAMIEREVLAGTLVPGEPLREADLMRWLGISRTPVREALTQLALTGLVDLTHQRTAHVAQMDSASASDVRRALAVLRVLEARLAIDREPAAVATAMSKASAQWERATTAEGVVAAAVRLVAPLHELCGNEILVHLAGTLAARIAWTARHRPDALAIPSRAGLERVRRALIEADAQGAERGIREVYLGETG